jgi:hypothetical protein
MAVTAEATSMTVVITAGIRDLIFIFSAVTMTGAAMCRLIVIADRSVVQLHTPAEAVMAAVATVAVMAAAISDEPHNFLNKKDLINL